MNHYAFQLRFGRDSNVMKTLEILIPTYGRPESAVAAIESCLAIEDSRLGVRCSSNGCDQSLEKYRNLDPRLAYSCFEINQGPHKNFLYLLKSAEARFCMLLSDEDRIDSAGLKEFLDFLDACDDNVGVVSCSIFDVVNDRYYHRPQGKFACMSLDGNAFAALSLAPTYMSGICFSKKCLVAADLERLFKTCPGNAYSHIDLAQNVLLKKNFKYYLPRLVLKGQDVKVGGDGYTHRNKIGITSDGNLDLNPAVYGPNARVRQFFYREKLITGIKNELHLIPYYLAKMHIFLFFLGATLRSPEIVRLNPGTFLKHEARNALLEAHTQDDFSGTMIARSFVTCLELPSPIRRVMISALTFTHKIIRKMFKSFLELRDRSEDCLNKSNL